MDEIDEAPLPEISLDSAKLEIGAEFANLHRRSRKQQQNETVADTFQQNEIVAERFSANPCRIRQLQNLQD
jgi:hypothetical protein